MEKYKLSRFNYKTLRPLIITALITTNITQIISDDFNIVDTIKGSYIQF